MNDTPPDVEERYRQMLLARSGEERLRMACSMFDTARRIVLSSILQANPGATPAEIRRALFLRFYGSDFDARQREAILAHLDRHSSRSANATGK